MKNFFHIVCFVFLILFETTAHSDSDSLSIYLVKNYWHVGIVFGVEHLDTNQLPCLDDFRRFKYIDIGWGDEEFYQSEGIDYYLGAKAILFPTSSVVRVAGYNFELKSIINSSDFCIQVVLNREQFDKLIEFIDSSFARDENTCIETSSKNAGAIRFFKSIHSYHLFNTCNTWIYDALIFTGLELGNVSVITSDDLFYALIKVGIILKS